MNALAIMQTVRMSSCDCHPRKKNKFLRFAIVKAIVRDEKIHWLRTGWLQPEPTQHDVFSRDLTIAGEAIAKKIGIPFMGSVRNRGTSDVSLLELLAAIKGENV